ncbi:Pr6Pr family membrane protein [Bifidobacterium apri]|uniref:Pr6Pr family membrane protein n=1 Tax=Bifidobacterium apri TaxID=1769423 RepID=UPI00399131C4
MRFIAGVWRLAIAALCFVGTYEAWTIPNRWVYFTFQTGFMLGLVMLWSGAASLLKGIQPPAWLKGCLTVYAIITALVAFLLMPPDDPHYVPQVLGIMTNTMLHRIAPVMAVIDFLLFDPHRRFKPSYVLSWMGYFPIYLAFVVIRAQLWPHSGPSVGGNPYPYTFIDLGQLGWSQFIVNVVELAIGFLLVALAVFLIDRILPEKSLLRSQ